VGDRINLVGSIPVADRFNLASFHDPVSAPTSGFGTSETSGGEARKSACGGNPDVELRPSKVRL
jgi:hypothetical protein